jgi:hypothetical protein
MEAVIVKGSNGHNRQPFNQKIAQEQEEWLARLDLEIYDYFLNK